MAEQYGYFNGIEYGEEFVALVNKTLVKTGVFYDGLTCRGSGMNVIVSEGSANVTGFLYNNSDDLTLSIDTAHASLPRKDSIMIRHDITNRRINAVVVKGTPQSNPVAPAPVRSTTYFDLKIAEVLISGGASSVGTITDTRADETVCGLVTGYDTADIASIVNRLVTLENRDYIVEQGTNGVWYYRKWNSGIAECWACTNFTFSNNQLWVSPWCYISAAAINYPFTFSDVPTCIFEKSDYSSLSLLTTAANGTASATPQFRLVRPNAFSANVTIKLSINAVGRFR